MDEQEQRSQAALQELNAINQMLVQRCVNLASESSVLRTAAVDAVGALEKFKAELGASKVILAKKKPAKAAG